VLIGGSTVCRTASTSGRLQAASTLAAACSGAIAIGARRGVPVRIGSGATPLGVGGGRGRIQCGTDEPPASLLLLLWRE